MAVKASESDDVLRVEESLDQERPAQVLSLDQIDQLDLSRLPADMRKKLNLPKIKALFQNAISISILVTGKTGSGKSTLVNGILGLKTDKEKAKEGKSITGSCTSKITKYQNKKDRIDVTVWDSPGLQDGTANQDLYLDQMAAECSQRDLTLYCIKIGDTRFVRGSDNPDVVAMKKLTETFGTDFWKNTVIVLTFANTVESFNVDWMDLSPEKKSINFQAVIQEWKEQIQKILACDAGVPKEIVDAIAIVPAGHYRIPSLHDCEYWLSALWFQCVDAIPSPEAKAALTKINIERFKRKEDVKPSDFKKEVEDQPIVIDAKFVKKHMGLGGLIATVLGGVGGLFPLGTIAVAIGVVLGMLIIAGAD